MAHQNSRSSNVSPNKTNHSALHPIHFFKCYVRGHVQIGSVFLEAFPLSLLNDTFFSGSVRGHQDVSPPGLRGVCCAYETVLSERRCPNMLSICGRHSCAQLPTWHAEVWIHGAILVLCSLVVMWKHCSAFHCQHPA